MEYKRMAEQAIRSSDERVHAMEVQMLGMKKIIEEMAMQIQSMKMAMEKMQSVRVNTTQVHGMQQTIEEMTAQRQVMQSTIRNMQAFHSEQLIQPLELTKTSSQPVQTTILDSGISTMQGICSQPHSIQPSSSTQLKNHDLFWLYILIV